MLGPGEPATIISVMAKASRDDSGIEGLLDVLWRPPVRAANRPTMFAMLTQVVRRGFWK